MLALRARAFRSWGEFPDFTFFGGNSEMRGYDYLEFLGHKSFYANAELRFPLIEAMLTPIGVLGGIRGTFFFNFGVAGHRRPADAHRGTSEPVTVRPVVDYVGDPDTQSVRARLRRSGDASPASGSTTRAPRTGSGLTTYAIGFPIHFDWSWLTLFNPAWEDAGVRLRRHAARGGARQRRVPGASASRCGSATTSRTFRARPERAPRRGAPGAGFAAAVSLRARIFRAALSMTCCVSRAALPRPDAVAGRPVIQREGMSAARMSSKSPSLTTLRGANSAMSIGPDQKSACLMRSQLRPRCADRGVRSGRGCAPGPTTP